ncbi:MAG: SRPBCC family protein [Bacteroidales bacterium]
MATDKTLIVEKHLEIAATPEQVWDTITNPDLVRQYFFGVNVETDWQPGSEIIFSGTFEGGSFRDKGIVLECDPARTLSYSYYSSFSGLEDLPENYSMVTYKLEKKDNRTLLILTQAGFANETSLQHADAAWDQVLNGLKKIAENI